MTENDLSFEAILATNRKKKFRVAKLWLRRVRWEWRGRVNSDSRRTEMELRLNHLMVEWEIKKIIPNSTAARLFWKVRPGAQPGDFDLELWWCAQKVVNPIDAIGCVIWEITPALVPPPDKKEKGVHFSITVTGPPKLLSPGEMFERLEKAYDLYRPLKKSVEESIIKKSSGRKVILD